MEAAAVVAVFVAVFAALVVPFYMMSGHVQAAEEKARLRRMAEHRMNARLLRFDI